MLVVLIVPKMRHYCIKAEFHIIVAPLVHLRIGYINSRECYKYNYVACGGNTTSPFVSGTYGWRDNEWASELGNSGDIVKHHGALFGMSSNIYDWVGAVPLSLATDGLSSTVLISEVIQTASSQSYCTYLSDVRGMIYFGQGGAFFTTYYEPNSTLPDQFSFGVYCHTPTVPLTPSAPCIASVSASNFTFRMSARSLHTGGVNAAFGDGSVHFISNTINRTLWRNLGDAADGNPVSIP
jgi:prepilin-type processing-associated H-X9-DG protein